MISSLKDSIHFDNPSDCQNMLLTNKDHHIQQKSPLFKTDTQPLSSYTLSQYHPSSAPANSTTISSSGSLSSDAAIPSRSNKQPVYSRATRMVQHRHMARRKGIEEKFNQSLKETLRREQTLQLPDALNSVAFSTLPSSDGAGDNQVGGGEMEVDHQGWYIYTQNHGLGAETATVTPADAEKRSSIISLPTSPLTTQPPARSSPEIVVPDSDEDDLQYPVSNAF